MKKTYKVTILHTMKVFGRIIETLEEKQMTIRELFAERLKTSNWIATDFHWEDFPEEYTHLIYCVRQGDTFHLWPHGYLVDDKTFYENVASNQGEGHTFDRVWAYHKF